MAVEHPDGTVFAGGFALAPEEPGPKLWKSVDHGQRWTRVNVGTATEGAIENSDVSLAMSRDGVLYFVTMGPARTRGEADGKNTIAVGATSDSGASWHWNVLSAMNPEFGDRPWVAYPLTGRPR